MNGPDHYREAERLLDEATSRGDFNPRAQWCLELAKLHTALAHVAATALTSDGPECAEVAGPWFCEMSLALPAGQDLNLPVGARQQAATRGGAGRAGVGCDDTGAANSGYISAGITALWEGEDPRRSRQSGNQHGAE